MPPEQDQTQYAAFLRGINVGGHTLIKMEDLRKAFESLGFQNVKTVLASGNVLFASSQKNTTLLSQIISQKLSETSGHEIMVTVRSLSDLKALEARQPFKDIANTPGTRSFVTFISENTKYRGPPDLPAPEGYKILNVSDGMICSILYEQPGIGAAELMSAIEKQFGKSVTTRSWNTISRMLKIGK